MQNHEFTLAANKVELHFLTWTQLKTSQTEPKNILESHNNFIITSSQTLYPWIPLGCQREKRNEETSAACGQVCWPSRTQSHLATCLVSLLYLVPQQDVYNNAGVCLELKAWRQMIWIIWRSQSVLRQPLGEKASGHSGLWRQFQRHFRGEFRRISLIPRKQHWQDKL